MAIASWSRQILGKATPIVGAATLGAIALVGVAKPADAIWIDSGDDELMTPPGNTYADFNLSEMGIDETIRVFLKGNPDMPGEPDTIVKREECHSDDLPDALVPCQAPIEMTKLHLMSVEPITIGDMLFDVFVDLDETQASTGTIIINPNGTFMTPEFHVFSKVSLEKVGTDEVFQMFERQDWFVGDGTWKSGDDGEFIITEFDEQALLARHTDKVPEPGTAIASIFGLGAMLGFTKKRLAKQDK